MKEHLEPEELDAVLFYVSEKLPPSPIQIKIHRSICESTGDILLQRFESMFDACIQYVLDVSIHEKARLSGTDTSTPDTARTVTHNNVITCVSAYRSLLPGTALEDDLQLIPRESDGRVRIGKFAVLLALNHFREEIIIAKKLKELGLDSEGVVFDKLKTMSISEADMLVIEYVEEASRTYNNDRAFDSQELEKLTLIKKQLGLSEESIFSRFFEIYKKGYGTES